MAGLILAANPLILAAIKPSIRCAKSRSRFGSSRSLRSIRNQLNTEEKRLRNLCKLLLGSILSDGEIDTAIFDPFGFPWRSKEWSDKIRRKVRGSYNAFEEGISEIHVTLEKIERALDLDSSVAIGAMLSESY